MTKILIVDDDRAVLETTQATLEDAGYDVITRDTAFGTSQIVLKNRPDVVLLDVEMPGLGGKELAKLLLEMPKMRVALFLYSGLDRTELEKAGREVGAVGVLHKSLAPRTFVRELQVGIERHMRRSSGWIERTPIAGDRASPGKK
jgi:DNA-binding response OmpR family regulator